MSSETKSGDAQMRYFCTYFDAAYADRAAALVESLSQHCASFRLWALCMDDAAFELVKAMALPGVVAVSLPEIEAWDPEFAATKTDRSKIEYYFTVTPVVALYVLEKHADVDLITYIDSDLYFFSSPEPIFAEMDRSSIGVIGHRFTDELRSHEQYGIYNVGFLPFRRDAAGIECLRWWRARCIEWCHDFVDGDRFADQKYLDKWPSLFMGVHEIAHKGANVAPWNLARYQVSARGETPFVDEQPVIFFHFHGLKRYAPGVFDPQLLRYASAPDKQIKHCVYEPYLQALERAAQRLSIAGVARGQSSIREASSGLRGMRQRARKAKMFATGVLNRSLIYYFNSRVL